MKFGEQLLVTTFATLRLCVFALVLVSCGGTH